MHTMSLRPVAAAIAIAIGLAAPATAATLDTTAMLRDGATHTGLIVRYHGTAQPDARNAQVRAQSLFATAATRARVVGARLAHVRQSAVGDVLRFAQPLDKPAMTQLMREIAADPRVASVEPDLQLTHTGLVRTASVPPDDPGYATQWHFHDAVGGIRAPETWATTTGAGKVVAVLDTGIVPHADMDANVIPGYDFVTEAWRSGRAADGRAPGGIDLGDWSNPGECYAQGNDSSWHGTHVAGTIAQLTDNGLMGAGVAHDAKILPVRVLGRCGGLLSDIADAIVWAAGGDVPGVPRNETPADVINLSLGGFASCLREHAMQQAIDSAASRGAIVVVAAGNANWDVQHFIPANCAQTITVGATDVHGARAWYSNFGTGIDIAAPGGGDDESDGHRAWIWQAVNAGKTVATTDAFAGMAGTSMASPHVAGIVALMQSVAPARMTTDTVQHFLNAAARPFPIAPGIPLGPGIIDASAAVGYAKEANPCALPAGCIPTNATTVVPRVATTVVAGSGAHNAGPVYRIEVPAGATLASIRTFGGTGDATLLLRFGAEPMSNAHDQRSARAGNTESIAVRSPRPGVWYAKVTGVHAGASLHVRID